jgi:hypothetical protein
MFSEINGAKLIRTKKSKPDFCHILTFKKLLVDIYENKIKYSRIFIYQIKNKKLNL